MMKDNLIDGPSDKVALAVYAGYDHNGALYDDTDFLKQIAAKNYQLRIHEATSADDFMKAVTSTKKASGKIDILFINAHGNVDGITLEDSDTGYMGISDFKALDETKLRELKRCFSVDARVILSSCSTGEGGPLSQNFANSMQGSFGVKYLYACEKTCSTDSLLWDKYGRLKQVKWNEDESSHTNKAFSRYQEVLADIDPELKDWIVANIIRSEDLSSNDDYDMIFERILFVKDIMPKVSDFEGLIKTLPGNKEKINRDIERMISDGATATNIELQYLGDYGVPELVFDIQSNSNCDLGTDRPLSEFNIKKMVGKLRVMHHRSKYKSSKVKRVSYDSGYGLIQNNEKNSELVMKGFIDENLEMLLKQVHPDNRKKVKQEIIDSAKECGTFQDAKDIFDAAVSSNPGEYAFISLFDFMPADERLKSAKFLFDSIDKRHSKEKIEQKFLSAN
jgi:hypothetical protein